MTPYHVSVLRVVLSWVVMLGMGEGRGHTAPDSGVRFVDEAAEAGIFLTNVSGSAEKRHIVETTGSGACFFDYDLDGDLDIYVVNGGTLEGKTPASAPRDALYENQGVGEFVDVTARAGVGDPGWGGGCYAADYDNDGDPDLYVTNYGPDVLYRNEGDRTFRDVTAQAGLVDRRWSTGAAFADFDRDGHLDLYVAGYLRFDPADAAAARRCRWKGADVMCGPRGFPAETHRVYRNRGNGSFAEATAAAGVAGAARFGLGVVVGDLDDDQDPDVVVANDSQENQLWVNDGAGRFVDQALAAGVALSVDGRAQAGMGVALGDYDNDGDEDLFITNFSDDYHALRRNDGHMVFTDVSAQVGLDSGPRSSLGWGNPFLDYDNDGDLDLFVASGHVYPQVDQHDPVTSYRQADRLFANEGGSFVDVSARSGPGLSLLHSSRGAAVGDYDDDGDLDLLVVNENDLPNLLRNDGGNRGRWLKIRLVGRQSNRDGIGARLSLEAGGRRQMREHRLQSGYYSSHDPRIHFGLGTAEAARLRIRWPSGREQSFPDLPADRLVTVDEEKGIVAMQELRGTPRPPAPYSEPPASPEGSRGPKTSPRPSARPRLTPRDLEVVDRLVQGGTRRVLAGQLAAGIQDYEAALARLPLWEDAAKSADAMGFGDAGRYQAFLSTLEDNMGVALMRAGRTAECAAPIERALQIRPGHVRLLRNLALCHFHGRRYRQSVSALRTAQEAGAPRVSYDLGRALALAGDCAAAEADLRRALGELAIPDLTGQRAEAWYHIGGCLAAGGRHREAADAFREALSLAPGHQKALFKLERAWRMDGQPGHAARVRDLFRARQGMDEAVRSVRLGGLSTPAERLALVRAQLEGGSPAAALTQLGMLLSAAPADAALLTLLGETYMAFRPPAADRAEEAFRRALSAAPGSTDAAAGLGEALLRAGRRDEAMARLQSALLAAPGHVGATVGAARLELETAHTAAARTRLREALGRAPGDVRVRRTLALVALARGDRQGAAEALALLEAQADPFDDTVEARLRALVLLGETARARSLIEGAPFAGASQREALARLLAPD